MSTTRTTARFGFKDALGVTLSKSFAEIDPSVQAAKLQALSAGIIANKEIYPVQPTMATKIELITTTTTEIPLS